MRELVDKYPKGRLSLWDLGTHKILAANRIEPDDDEAEETLDDMIEDFGKDMHHNSYLKVPYKTESGKIEYVEKYFSFKPGIDSQTED